MNFLLWMVQIGLAILFLMAGGMKTFSPLADLSAQMPWVADVPGWVPRAAGFSEILAGFGLILPAATRVKPFLTPLAAAGLALVMALAAGFHLFRGEIPPVGITTILFLACVFVMYGRIKLVPIAPK